jgi:hypothetical protein
MQALTDCKLCSDHTDPPMLDLQGADGGRLDPSYQACSGPRLQSAEAQSRVVKIHRSGKKPFSCLSAYPIGKVVRPRFDCVAKLIKSLPKIRPLVQLYTFGV